MPQDDLPIGPQLSKVRNAKVDILDHNDPYWVDVDLDNKLVLTSEEHKALEKGKILVISPESNATLYIHLP